MLEVDESKLNKLTEESMKRKERIKQLREKANKQQQSNGSGSDANDEKLSKPKFRSYKPQNENTEVEVVTQDPTGHIEKAVESQLDLLKQPMVVDEIDITSLAPRKPDWDLKRDIAKKLEKLERRTQKAIAELIRERLANDKFNSNLYQNITEGPTITGDAINEDDCR